MAQITLTVPDEKIARIVAAARWHARDLPPDASDADAVRALVKERIIDILWIYERKIASDSIRKDNLE